MLKSSILIFFIGIGIIAIVMTLLFMMVKLLSSDLFVPKKDRAKLETPKPTKDGSLGLEETGLDDSNEIDETTRVLIAAAVFAKIGPKAHIRSIRLQQNAGDRQAWVGENLRQGHAKGANRWT